MKRILFLLVFTLTFLPCFSQDLTDKKVALFQFPIVIEVQNDQGDMDTREYLKQYGTKGKTRALETMYEIMMPFISERFAQVGVVLMPCEELSAVKSNPYGVPSMMIKKAIKSCEQADYFIKMTIKDITVINPQAQQTDLSVKMRTLNVRCRINLLDRDKNNIKSLEAIFNSSDQIESDRNIGIDIRRITGPQREQELKVYESCCKMAFLRALDKW